MTGETNVQVAEPVDVERQQAIVRLRVSKREHDDDLRKRGLEDGRQWAMQAAEVAELRRLCRLQKACTLDCDNRYEARNSSYGPGEHFYFGIAPDYDGDRRAAHDFWEEVLDDETDLADDSAFVLGFADGAIEFYDEIEAGL